MKNIKAPGWAWTFLGCVLVAVNGVSKPRPPFPPLPERQLASWRFNGPSEADSPALLSVNLDTIESWSGHALDMSGAGKRLLAVEEIPPAGTIRFWLAPYWPIAFEGVGGPGAEARLLEFGHWGLAGAQARGSLSVNPQGTAIRFFALTGTEPVHLLSAPISWCAREWHQVALSWSADRTVLHLDGKRVAEGPGLMLSPFVQLDAAAGFCLGSDVHGNHLAQGQFEELTLFARPCSDAELKTDFQHNVSLAARGPITPEEEQAMFAAMAQSAAQAPFGPESMGALAGDGCGLWLSIARQPNDAVKVTLHNTIPSKTYQILSTANLALQNWSVEQTITGAAGQDYTDAIIPQNQRPILFLQAKERAPYEVDLSFKGIGFGQFGSQATTPDTMGAVGPNHFIELLNDGHPGSNLGSVALFSKSGILLQIVRHTEFFAVPGYENLRFLIDPRILFDHDLQHPRWIACIQDQVSLNVILAISAGPNPTDLLSGWTKYVVPVARPTILLSQLMPTESTCPRRTWIRLPAAVTASAVKDIKSWRSTKTSCTIRVYSSLTHSTLV